MKTVRICPGCGAPLPTDAPAGLCPACLLKTQSPTNPGDGGAANPSADTSRPVPIPGQTFGSYRILRLLGQGGMGDVYEAEHVETGRRLALKVMGHTLASEEDRKRFLREGRLAASVNHPNVVYVHTSEEIDGVPVIAMELVHDGTLKDRLKREGPLPVAEAVEAALQLIAGLEAAHAAGVLHRDIKPANCFVAADGTVKVGDFGLSISTLARGESLLTAKGAVVGTPAYASPEQLRGEELDVRSDIYSVGATLYHLLTGKPPFAATDFVKLITEVLDKKPEPPVTARPDIPAKLSRLILRCLGKDRAARFQTYGELRDALLPFRAGEVTPARPALRVLAAILDDLVAYAPSLLFLMYWSFDPLDKWMRERTMAAALVWLPFYLWHLFYYAVSEGLWGAALGKTLCGLRVVGPDRQAPGLGRALMRTLIYTAPLTLPSFACMALVPLAELRQALARGELTMTDWLLLPLLLLLFVTMRQRNGYAAVHDLLSKTRVIVRPKTQPRPKLIELVPAFPGAASDSLTQDEVASCPSGTFGPYEARASLWRHGGEELLLAFDPALRRRVWLHLRPANAVPISMARRDLSRVARLRWLSAGQSATHRWDAYEAVDGAPLLSLCQKPQPWKAVRFWLLDLAEEISAATNDDDTALTLSLDRLWISSAGRALLLDFPCPGAPSSESAGAAIPIHDLAGLQRFIHTVARVALEERGGESAQPCSDSVVWRAPLPLHARGFFASLAKGAFEKVEFVLGNLHSLVSKPPEVTRAWRAASLALVPASLALLGIVISAMVNFERIRWERAWANGYSGKPSLRSAGKVYTQTLEQRKEGSATEHDVALARAYLVHHFGDVLTNENFWANTQLSAVFAETERALLQEAAAGDSPPKPEDLQEAEVKVTEWIHWHDRVERSIQLWIFAGTLLFGGGMFAFIELVGYLLFGLSPILRLFGMTVVDRNGQAASRLKLLWRWTLVWVPAGLLCLMAAGVLILSVALNLPTPQTNPLAISLFDKLDWVIGGIAGASLLALAVYAALSPQRGLQDRLAGTWLVPR